MFSVSSVLHDTAYVRNVAAVLHGTACLCSVASVLHDTVYMFNVRLFYMLRLMCVMYHLLYKIRCM
jgi:hypothetical protein